MEEATHLSTRVAVLATHLLDIGSPHHLRLKHADGFHIHLITKSGIRTTEEEYNNIEEWIITKIRQMGGECALQEGWKCWGGQMRFSVPVIHQAPQPGQVFNEKNEKASGVKSGPMNGCTTTTTAALDRIDSFLPSRPHVQPRSSHKNPISVSSLFTLLEASKSELGLEHFTVSPNTFDEVFLNIVRKHNVDEEDFKTKPSLKWMGWRKGFKRIAAEDHSLG
jgi:ATP-binding cassette, subfamily A (ABC1), member 3